MSKLPKYWNQLSTVDFCLIDFEKAVAVWPLGATEQHGPHLPLSVDTDLVTAVAVESLKHLLDSDPVFFLPPQSIGFSEEHSAFAGTLSLSAETLLAIAREIGACLARTGMKKLLLFNSHGGNVSLMDLIARELRGKFGLLVFSTSWYQLPLDPSALANFTAHEHRYGVHAGDVETSMMLQIAPELVRMQVAQNFMSASADRSNNYEILGDGKSAKLGWHIQDYNPLGAVGDAKSATAEKGEKLLQSAGFQLAKLLQELITMPPLSVRS
jgi:creatinine amidohydrolase